MNAPSPRVLVIVRTALVAVALPLVFSLGSRACVNGQQFHPAAVPSPLLGDVEAVFAGMVPAELMRASMSPATVASALGEMRHAHLATHRNHYAAFAERFEAIQPRRGGAGATLDYAIALLHLGRVAEAIGVLEGLEAARPGIYETAATLGTAYELAGRVEDAATWIAKGIERNPAAHDSSEWLHLAILRAKLQLRADARWLETHNVLDGAGPRDATEIVRAIERQLHERLVFVGPADAIMCDLFFQAARRLSGEEAAERRAHYLRESLRFGDWRKAQIAQLKS